MLEATGRLQKCRVYQMSDNKKYLYSFKVLQREINIWSMQMGRFLK
jgi:hypothetical protein